MINTTPLLHKPRLSNFVRAIRIVLLTILAYIFFTSAPLSIAVTFNPSPIPVEGGGVDFSAEEGFPQPDGEAGIGESFPPPTLPDSVGQTTSNQLWKILFFGLPIGVGGAALAYYYLSRRKKTKPEIDLAKQRDQKRKEDIQRLQTMVEAFKKMKDVYPDPRQFEEIVTAMAPKVEDPLEGQKVGKKDEVFGYYYDNWDPETSKNTTDTYRLWGFLEKQDDPEVEDGKYLVTPETYGKKPKALKVSELEEELETKIEEKPSKVQLQKPQTAAFTKTQTPSAEATVYFPAQDKLSQIMLIILSLVIFMVTLINAYMVFKLSQLSDYLLRHLVQKF